MAWHMGYPLSQSLFSSYHIDRLLWPEPKNLEEASFGRQAPVTGNSMLHVVFRAYCIALVKCCDHVHRKIGAEHYYEVSYIEPYLRSSPILVARALKSSGRGFCIESLQSKPSNELRRIPSTVASTRSHVFHGGASEYGRSSSTCNNNSTYVQTTSFESYGIRSQPG